MFLEDLLFSIIGQTRYSEFTLYLEKSNSNIKKFFKNYSYIIASTILLLILFVSLNFINLITFIIVFIIQFPLILFLYYIFILFKENEKQKYIESILQDVLLQASLFPKGTEITKIIQYISEQDYKYISLEFKIALKQIKKGYSITKSLQEICSRNKNKLLERVINLLIIGYKSGKDMHFVFNKISQYILRIQELERERYSSLAIQKYTLLLASAILVPLILGWVQNIISQFDFSAFTTIGINIADSNLGEYAKYATWIYLGELSIISSFFIALIDGNKMKFVLYLIFIMPIAYLVFFFV